MAQASKDTLDIQGISSRRKALLNKLGIYDLWDLINFFPREYEDWTRPGTADQVSPDGKGTFFAAVASTPVLRRIGKMSILKVTLRDANDSRVFATWFNQPYYQDRLKLGEEYIFRGKIKNNGIITEIINPAFESVDKDDRVGIKPVYPLTSGLTQGVIRNMIWKALESELHKIEDGLPDSLRMKYRLCSAAYAYEKIHRPNDAEEFAIAKKRLVFEELFMIQAGLRLVKTTIAHKERAVPIRADWEKMRTFYDSLPFVLTDSQQKVIYEILSDISKDVPMNRLIQGDVGSGKTVISATAVAACMINGSQAALMAPTSVLAHQHYLTFQSFFRSDPSRIALLTGDVTGNKRKEILSRLLNGEISLLIGTHAVIGEKVKFRELALAITDEQHRFGVKQRSRLGKGEGAIPHVLVMSATPIPRTLGFVLYGDLDISVVKGLPAGRMPVETYTASSKDDSRIYDLINRHTDRGRQAYIVCPMIDSTRESDLLSVNELHKELSDRIFPDKKVGLLHGGMRPSEKEAVMTAFMNMEIDILVSTTVIEVGVDNPNATIMLIQYAERFGLAQLHQLRGRIGRGSHRSVCILKSDTDQKLAVERMKILCKSNDGFVIAEKDLQLRGTGDFFGTRQHGIPDLRIADLYTDTELLEESRKAMLEMFNDDPLLGKPENRSVLPHIRRRFGSLLENIGL